MVTGVAVCVNINKMEWQITFKGSSCGLNQRIRRFYQQVDGLAVTLHQPFFPCRLITDNRDLRQSAHRPRESSLKSRGKFYGYRIRSNLVKCHAYQLGTFHAVMECRQGMDRAELFQVETVRHRSVEIGERFVSEDTGYGEPHQFQRGTAAGSGHFECITGDIDAISHGIEFIFFVGTLQECDYIF